MNVQPERQDDHTKNIYLPDWLAKYLFKHRKRKINKVRCTSETKSVMSNAASDKGTYKASSTLTGNGAVFGDKLSPFPATIIASVDEA